MSDYSEGIQEITAKVGEWSKEHIASKYKLEKLVPATDLLLHVGYSIVSGGGLPQWMIEGVLSGALKRFSRK